MTSLRTEKKKRQATLMVDSVANTQRSRRSRCRPRRCRLSRRGSVGGYE